MTMKYLQRKIREFAMWLYDVTNAWVVPKYIYGMIDRNEFNEVEEILDQQEKHFPSDLEITYARALCQFLCNVVEGEDKDEKEDV